jgi:hypothetical protein
MVLVALIVAIAIFDLFAIWFGVDSRDGVGDPRRTSPSFWSNEGIER